MSARLVIAAVSGLVLLAGCSSGDDPAPSSTTSTTTATSTSSVSPSTSGTASPTTTGTATGTASASGDPALTNSPTLPPPLTTGSIADIEVKDGDKPTLSLKTTPWGVGTTASKVVKAGTGETLTEGMQARVRYVLTSGASGEELVNGFDMDPVVIPLDDSTVAFMSKALVGQKVGARVLVASSAADAFGELGNAQIGVGPNESLAVMLEVTAAAKTLKSAEGTAVPPKAGLPTVTMNVDKPATITVPKTAAPTQLVTQQLIKGTGPEVKSGQSITVHYTGVIWADGKVFDSSMNRGTPATFDIGTGNVISGWDKSLVGQPVGSRLLLVIPPSEGYGESGSQDGSIKPTDTIVFVVDILAAI